MIEFWRNRKILLLIVVIACGVLIGITIGYSSLFSIFWAGIVFIVFFINRPQELFLLNFFINVGLGATFLLKYRIGILALSDISLLCFAAAVMLKAYRRRDYTNIRLILKQKDVFLLFGFFISSFILGILSRYSIYNIFQDVKLFLYFIFPYIYLKYFIPKDNVFLKKLFYTGIVTSLVICLEEILSFRSVGIVNMVQNDFGNRDVWISIIFIPIFSSILAYSRRSELIKINRIIYFALQALYVLCIIISFTRTVWLQAILTFVAYHVFLVKRENKGRLAQLKTIMFILVCIVALILIEPISSYSIWVDAINQRLFTFKLMTIGGVDTLKIRFNDTGLLLEKLASIKIFWGFGLGDSIIKPDLLREITIAENSFLYYTWKYGLIASLTLFIYMIKRTLYFLKSLEYLKKNIGLSIAIFFLIGNFSGNLNLYYYMTIIALFLAYDFDQGTINIKR